MVGVVGSSPIAPTNEINDLRHFRVPFSLLVRKMYEKVGFKSLLFSRTAH